MKQIQMTLATAQMKTLCCKKNNMFFFLTKTFALHLCNFNIVENINIVKIAFSQNVNIYKVSSFKDFENAVFVSKSFSW